MPGKMNMVGIILKQLQKLGASCDWERTAFTMDESRSEHVTKAFVDLFNKGKLYRGPTHGQLRILKRRLYSPMKKYSMKMK